ncbi:ABC transporter substrate-binding protein [Bradyrhizobium australiense]|uniref:ABC transporter substrate-binding protein n=1 Tax=Bradyrhizobium australiense TaxID=2721161 RepID=A0A7Y4LYK2_9BRAD|nr:ABC transporter substrate-binding protein [Bradyrhizobium australiense]NOJ43603.1 ABC transporter substrate-binding protein [Bradyrhizobium australiense]
MRRSLVLAALLAAAVPSEAFSQKSYGPGVTDTEIRIGQTVPYKGPLSALAIFGRVEAAYVRKINQAGGINGRKVTLISLDDAFSPPKTVEQTRKLVEDNGVLAIVGSTGTPTNLAVAKYLNANKVPQILILASSPKLHDPENLPWTTTFFMSQAVEMKFYADYLLSSKPGAKVAVLYQNDDLGKGNLSAFRTALGAEVSTMIVREAAYDVADPTVDSQIVALKASGANTLFHASSPKFAAQSIRKAHELGWKVEHILLSGVSDIPTVLRPAGLEASRGAVTARWVKSLDDPTWADDPAVKDYLAFLKQWMPGETNDDPGAILAYSTAQMIEEVLRRCGNDLTRENLLRQATNVRDLQLPMFLPGVKVNISPNDRIPWRQARMARFDGTQWVYFGDIVSAPSSSD